MRHTIKTLLSIFSFFIFSNLTANPMLKELNTGWRFKQVRLNNWYPATVPGVVHTDLLANKIIEDPYFKLNERGVQWVDKEDWIYETFFDLEDQFFNKKNISLNFKGLDTYADVYLNDVKILVADNMFREWDVNIKEIIKEKNNHLKVYFHSPIKIDLPKWESLPFQYQATNDQSENGGLFNRKVSIFARKAGYHYGWDWGPRIVTSGIWRPIFVKAWDEAYIDNIHYIQREVSKQKAVIETAIEINADQEISSANIEISDEESGKIFVSKSIQLEKGLNKIQVDFQINKPELWWSNGLGKPHLYSFKTQIKKDNKSIDNKSNKIGLRSIRLIRQPDKHGKSFYFELNGVPVFAKGANYIPNDIFLPRITKETYKKTVLDAVNANMNMLRIWGGGIYEDDYFYELCDEYGIMVWQDFMFACSLYPAEGQLLENIRQEAIDNVKRLRNHASIAIWCGNNECLDAWAMWGWKRDYTAQDPKIADKIWKEFQNQYFVVLPEVVKEFDPMAYYTPSSPFTDIDGRRDKTDGDMHYWEPWQKALPIDTYNHEKSRFFSEYGFQSFPEFNTVKLYAPDKEDWNITSEVMMSHQRAGTNANNTIAKCLLNEYGEAKDFKAFLYMSQVLQADAMKIAMEAHRRNMGYCMGSLFWQHNDCWPVASWSSRDYYGRWKAQHYFTRKAFDDILISPIKEDNKINVYGISDRLTQTKGKLRLQVITLNGEKINEITKTVNMRANCSAILISEDIEYLAKGAATKDIVIHVEFIDEKGKIYSNNYFLQSQKTIDFPKTKIQYKINPIKDGYELELSSRYFARAVYMSIDDVDNFFEDNFFDILPNQTVKTTVKTTLSQTEFEKQLNITSLSESLL